MGASPRYEISDGAVLPPASTANGCAGASGMQMKFLWTTRTFDLLRFCALVVPMLGAVLWAIWSLAQQTERAQEQASENAALVELYTERLIQAQTVLQKATSGFLEDRRPYLVDNSASLRAFLSELKEAQLSSQGIAVLAADGNVLATSDNFPQDFEFSSEEYHRILTDFGPPFLDRLERPGDSDVFVVARPIPLGDNYGIFVSALKVSAIRQFLQGVATRSGDAASLMREDGKLLLRNRPTKPMALKPGSVAMRLVAEGDDAHYRTVAVSDNIDRFYAFSRVGSLSLFANYGIPVASVQSAWLLQALPVWLFLTASGLLTYLLLGRMQRELSEGLHQRETVELLRAAQQLAGQRAQLLQELNHRVKNNLATVSGLISLQLRQTGSVDPETLKSRLQAVTEVHALLYRAPENDSVDLAQLFTRLAHSAAIVPPERGIVVDCDLEEGVAVGPDSATPLALVVAELLTNAVKHAFPEGHAGRIALRLARSGDCAALEIADDGVGMPADRARTSGLNIVKGLVSQAEATLIRTNGPGTSYRIVFPVLGLTLPDLGGKNLS